MTETRQIQTTVAKAVADFIRHLRERNASPHTIKAYSRDLSLFAVYAGSRGWKQIDHIAVRGFLSQLYENGLSKPSVARALAAVRSLSLAGPRRRRGAKSGKARLHAQAPQKTPTRAHD